MTGLLDLDDALAIIADKVSAITDVETCALQNGIKRITAQDIASPYALPPFTNTAVDGYAFCHADGNKLDLAGASFAGSPYEGALQKGQAVRIATGAVLPDGADTVAMQECCTVEGGRVVIDPLPDKGASVRHRGADIAAGSVAVKKGQSLRPQDIALLGALGLTHAQVIRPVRVAIASTGQELQAHGASLQHGQIIDTNSLMLQHMLENGGCHVSILPPLPDDLDQTRQALSSAARDCDLIVTSGGVSVGDKDFVREALSQEGEIYFWRLAIRPGKPVLFGRTGKAFFIGLPGNPVSSFVTCLLMVRTIVAALQGAPQALPPYFEVTLAEAIKKDVKLRCFLRAKLVASGSGYAAKAYDDQSSNLFSSLTDSDGLIDLAKEDGDQPSGATVRFRPFKGWLS